MPTPNPSNIRTFRGPDSRAVLAIVKAALGPDAMILSSREIASSLFRPATVEVTAALVEEEVFEEKAQPVDVEPRQTRVGADVERDLDALRACVQETQSALSLVTRQARAGNDLQLAPAAAEFHAYLTLLGFDPAIAEELVRNLSQGGVPRTAAGFREPARQQIGRIARACPPPWQPLADRKRRVITLIGPTGVGKTTTLAKIAARALLDHRQKVALITLDTYRIGAAEQIGHYGNLMHVPTYVARNRAELSTALSGCADATLVLIDTAGRSNMDDVLKQAELARAIVGVELHLVLSAVTGAADLSGIARRYHSLLPSQLIFTKVDEASAPGGLLSALAVAKRPVSCITNGQRVPEDIQPQSDSEIVDLLLGESKWDRGRN